jgi:hypothetical protein
MKVLPLLVIMLLGPIQAAAQVFAYEHDVRAAVNLSALSTALEKLSGTRYRAKFHNNGTVCTTPRLEVNVGNAKIKSSTFLHGLDGRSGLGLKLGIDPSAEVHKCGDWGVPAICDWATSFTGLEPAYQVVGVCRVRILFWVFQYSVNFPIPNPFVIPRQLPVSLADVFSPDDPTTLEFGEFDGQNWTPAKNPKLRTIAILPSVSGTRGTKVPVSNPKLLFAEDVKDLAIDVAVGPGRAVDVKTADALQAAHDADVPLGTDGFVGLSIAPSFFGQGGGHVNGAGIFGSILPIRITGIRKIGQYKLQFEAILSEAYASFVTIKGDPKVVVDFKFGKVEIANLTLAGKKVPVKKVGARLVLAAPQTDANGVMKLNIEDFRISIEGESSTFACLCLDSGNLNKQIGDNMPPIVAVVQTIRVEAPECIALGDTRFEAIDRDERTYRCKSFGNESNGYMANNNQEKSTTITLNPANLKPSIEGGRLVWRVANSQ